MIGRAVMINRNRVFSACIALVGSLSSVSAEVIDLDGDGFGRITGAVLDFNAPRQAPAPEVELSQQPSASEMASVARVPTSRPLYGSRRGSAAVEALIADVAMSYVGHEGLRRANVSVTDWAALFRANIAIESNFQQSARSPVGAIGLGQLMPDTARQLGVNPHDAEENLRGSARYLLMMMERFGSVELALAAYNAGPEAVSRYGGIPPYRETEGHVRKVLSVFVATRGRNET